MYYLLLFIRKKIIIAETDNKQTKLINELKGIDKGVKPAEKISFLNNRKREKILNDFKSR